MAEDRPWKPAEGDAPTFDAPHRSPDAVPGSEPTLHRPAAPGSEPTVVPAPAGPLSRAPSEVPTGRPFGRYVLLQELGHGGMGVVWKAYDTQLRRIVALKGMIAEQFAEASQVERFMREARAAARLSHPHIVPVYDVGEHDGQHYFTTEFIEGLPLDAVMRTQVAPKQALAWVKAIAEGLHYAHQQGIVHRDVKPGNVLIDKDGQPHVMDFGLAKQVEEEGSSAGPSLTLSGDLLGTPRYMSPEQTRGAQGVGPASDQFSLGVVMYELLTGRPPFAGTDMRSLLNAVAEADPVRPTAANPRIHRDVETICLKALEKDPARRYPMIGDLAADIGRYFEGEPIEARPISFAGRAWRTAVRYRKALAPAAVALALAIGLGGWMAAGAWRRGAQVETWLAEARRAEADAEALPLGPAAKEAFERAKDRLSRVLGADRSQPEANGALARVERRLSAIAEAERAEREKATLGRARAEEALEKSKPVSDVLYRFRDLAPTVEAMDAVFTDTALPLAEKRTRNAAAWEEVAHWMEGTPKDPASQATMLAFAGWVRRLAGYEEEGLAWMKRAGDLDPDIPYAAFLRALVPFSRFVENQALPGLVEGLGGVEFKPMPPEVPETAALRREVEAALAEVEKARVWGAQASQANRVALTGLRAAQREDYAAAEEALTLAVESLDLRVLRVPLRWERAKVRYLRKEFPAAIADMKLVKAAWPGRPRAWYDAALMTWSAALEAASKGQDPRAAYREAIADCDESLRRDLTDAVTYNGRGLMLTSLGEAELARGEDPRESYRKAVADFGEAIRREYAGGEAYVNRGNAFRSLAVAEAGRGEDPRESCRKAIADYQEFIKGHAERPDGYLGSASAYAGLGDAEAARGLDPTESFRRSIASFGEALARAPDNTTAYNNRGHAWRLIGDREAERGIDPRGSYERAIADFGELLKRIPGCALAFLGRGDATSAIGQTEQARGLDPRATCRKAIADYDEALAHNPEMVGAYNGRGIAVMTVGQADFALGQDPRESLRKAVADFGEVLKRDPELIEAYNNRGNALSSLGGAETARGEDARETYRKAVADFGEALKRNPTNEVLHFNRGNRYSELGKAEEAHGEDGRETFKKAIADFDASLARNPEMAHAFNGRGCAFWNMGEAEGKRGGDARGCYDKAIADIGEALKRDAGSAEAWNNRAGVESKLAELEQAQGKDPRATYEKALSDFSQAIARNPGMWIAHGNKGLIFEAMGEPAKAVECYQRALALVGDNYPPLKEWLARARQAAGAGGGSR